jgi:peptide/nickel transport system permease protein
MTAADILLTFPALVLALVIVSLRRPGLSTAVLAITVIGIPGTARIVRANALTYSTREFVTAARVVGARDSRIILREIVPNLVPVLVSYACLGIALAIVAEGSLAYLNLSVQDPASSWGLMILNGQAAISTDPQVALIPAATFLLTVLSFNVLGEKVRAGFGVRGRAL